MKSNHITNDIPHSLLEGIKRKTASTQIAHRNTYIQQKRTWLQHPPSPKRWAGAMPAESPKASWHNVNWGKGHRDPPALPGPLQYILNLHLKVIL